MTRGRAEPEIISASFRLGDLCCCRRFAYRERAELSAFRAFANIGKIRRVPYRRAPLVAATLIAAAAIGLQGQDGARSQGGSKDPPLRATGVQTYDAPVAGARSPRNASYDIDVRLDHAARTLRGRETIRWRNTSAMATSELQFHLYWNAWRNADSTWLRERRMARNYTAPRPDGWGAMDVSVRAAARAIRIDPRPDDATRFIAPDDGNAQDRTVMAVPLGLAVQPNETIQVEVEWTREHPASVRAHGLHRRLLLHGPVVSEAGRARRCRLEHAPVPRAHRVLRGLWRLRRAHHRPHAVHRRRHGPSDGTHRQQRRLDDVPLSR